MEPTLQANSSKVTVEVTDPSGVFPSVKSLLAERLPLRNLHWKSPTRPLRSIDSLHIDLVPAKATSDDQSSTSDNAAGAVTQRRHQIPGLRQTPYLKIYLLRCDDNETYKASSRKLLREWIKSNAPPSQSTTSLNNQENHDAFEWLVVHIVLPDTPAASQPRTSKKDSGASDSTEKLGGTSSSKWPGRVSSTVLEKIKSDFNGSSKSSVDRVAQVRVPKDHAQQRAVSSVLGPSELESQWEDLVSKLKSSILASFDLRVSQYEEDIREKDSQRNLPGWNFCTFFILKEGLARGFENVGLFEDALIGYDELAVGLDVIIREQAAGAGDEHGGTFLSYSADLMQEAQEAIESSISEGVALSKNENEDESVSLDLASDSFPLDTSKKPYRDMILANNISVFDFRTYLFTRQMMLLLKAANSTSFGIENSTLADAHSKERKEEDAQNFPTLAEICRRATEFISIGARTLRNEVESALSGTDEPFERSAGSEGRILSSVIENLVSSWTYSAALQVLTQTATTDLILPETSLRDSKSGSNSVKQETGKINPSELKWPVPRRSSSLLKSPSAPARPTSQELFSADLHATGFGSRPNLQSKGSGQSISHKTGTEELALGRAELYILARRVLQDIGRRQGWLVGWTNLGLLYHEADFDKADLEEVSLDDEDNKERVDNPKTTEKSTHVLNGLGLQTLVFAAELEKYFNLLYETLTDQAFRHYVAANRMKLAERTITDVAALRFRSGDYASAASYFHQIAPFYGDGHWNLLEGTALELYAQCLKHLDRNEEYVRVLLKLLAKYAAEKKPLKQHAPMSMMTREYIHELVTNSSKMQKVISAPLDDFFGDVEVDPTIRRNGNSDGFQLQLSWRPLLGTKIKLQSVRVRLVSTSDPQASDIWLESPEPETATVSTGAILVGTNISVSGWYFVEKIEFRTENIIFVHDSISRIPLALGLRDSAGSDSSLGKHQQVFCYPAARGLEAKMLPPSRINLAEPRSMELELGSGWNEISKGLLRIRSATAGLRVRVAEAKVVYGDFDIRGNPEPGTIEFANMDSDSSVRIKIPYSIENDPSSIAARLEVMYETKQGRFSYFLTTSVNTVLPVSVNVQDIFKEKALFSRFTISPATLIPLRILSCDIPSTKLYEVQSSLTEPMVLDVFPKQPASLLYKFVQREDDSAERQVGKQPLALTINFKCLDEEALTRVEQTFKADIEKSEIRGLSRMLIPHLMESFRNQWTSNDLETTGLLREAQILSFDEVGWDSILGALRGGLHKEVKQWLMEWHKRNPVLPLLDVDASQEHDASNISRQIVIPVDVPQIDVVHTAELRIMNANGQHRHLPHFAVGDMLAAELRIKHTRRWGGTTPKSNDIEFSYEVHANPDLWLVGGHRRGNFTCPENTLSTFPIMLLPQRAGHLLLPALDIKTFVSLSETMHSGAAGTFLLPRKQVPCEVDYHTHAETVLVLPDLKSTTVSLDGGPGGGSRLVESERRIELVP